MLTSDSSSAARRVRLADDAEVTGRGVAREDAVLAPGGELLDLGPRLAALGFQDFLERGRGHEFEFDRLHLAKPD